ncbi:MAG TPA: hypothetical protein VKU19_30740 [Bryobacteraceae bacterium]|nr:hypothetical protein [Bryobacteraceae bacterium]
MSARKLGVVAANGVRRVVVCLQFSVSPLQHHSTVPNLVVVFLKQARSAYPLAPSGV